MFVGRHLLELATMTHSSPLSAAINIPSLGIILATILILLQFSHPNSIISCDDSLQRGSLSPSHHQEPTTHHHLPDDSQNGFSCLSCNVILGSLMEAVKHNATMDKLDKMMHSLCHNVHFCDEFVDKVTIVLPHLARLAESQEYSSRALCSMLDFCEVDCCLTDTTPEQVHLGLNEHGRASVAWVTQKPQCTEVQLEGSIAHDSLNRKVLYTEHINTSGYQRTYRNGGWRGWLHFVDDLGPSPLVHQTPDGDPITHRYRVGCSNTNSWSQWFNMRVGVHARQVVVLGDMGLHNSEHNLQRMQQHLDDIDMIIILGDQSYADGNQQKWDEFMRHFEPVFAQRPLVTITGNHEVSIIGLKSLNITGYPHRFLLPHIDMSRVPLNGGSVWYYSFDFGPLHVISLDSESTLDLPLIIDEQIEWLKQDLKKVNRSKTPFIIVQSHRPFYCTQSGTGACDPAQMGYMRGRVESLFKEWKVDLVLSGHRHNYERSEVVYNKATTDEFKIVYVVNGIGGNREPMQTFGHHIPEYSMFRMTGHRGYGLLSWNEDATKLDWKLFLSEKDMLMDSARLKSRISQKDWG